MRILYSTSADKGNTWSPKADVSLAPAGVDHAFPSVAAGAAGDIRIAWMDQRTEPHWNVYYRSSTDGGSTWSGETVLSTFVTGYTYIFTDGFRFPFGDYFDMDIDSQSHTLVAWGEGYNWLTPGNVLVHAPALKRIKRWRRRGRDLTVFLFPGDPHHSAPSQADERSTILGPQLATAHGSARFNTFRSKSGLATIRTICRRDNFRMADNPPRTLVCRFSLSPFLARKGHI